MFYENLEKLQNYDTRVDVGWIYNQIPSKDYNILRIEIINCRVYLNVFNKSRTVMKSIHIGLSTIREGSFEFKYNAGDIYQTLFLSKFVENIEIQKEESIYRVCMSLSNGIEITSVQRFTVEKINLNYSLNSLKYNDYLLLPKNHLEWLKPLVKNYLVRFKLYKLECWLDILSHPSVPNNMIIQMNDVDLHCNKPTEVVVEGKLLKEVLQHFSDYKGMPVIEISVSENKPLILSDDNCCKWFIAPKVYE